MDLTEKQLDMSVADLSVRQLISLLGFVETKQKKGDSLFDDDWLEGQAGVARYLHCSKASISRYMKEGIFNNTYIVSGRTHWFNKAKIDRVIKDNPKFQ